MALNRSHKDFPEYERKWKALIQEEEKEIAAEEEREGDVRPCQDGPVDAIRKKYNMKRSALKKEYRHLYR